ncbi:hypothetical protein [Bacillus horti]|uniref:Uncharacterized protein n=1 Tax=Caldalkalibacillus horti TaxID=77523 RepID=A0ABT9VUM8_9BACI|nr:hypothetical protein [Bacillus horti]MDQ0164584.1 hypothetical protein [Bacillus horti]
MNHEFHSHSHDLKQVCITYVHHYVRIKIHDGKTYEGMIEHVDDQNVHMIAPDMNPRVSQDFEMSNITQVNDSGQYERQFYPGYYPYGYGPYGYGYGYGYGPFYPGYRRFVLPLAALSALTLLPFFW